jgi:hypothetical protein
MLPARQDSSNVNWQNNMQVGTFDRIAGATIFISIGYTLFAATSWDWFPTPGDWGHIARIPKGTKNYIALLLPPSITLLYLIVRRRYFERKS